MCSVLFHALLLLLLQLLIGFECGVVVLWDLKCKKADYRYNYDEVRHFFSLHPVLMGKLVSLVMVVSTAFLVLSATSFTI